jgi:glycosyltransferase involved in cell wall biosynthesis
MSRVLKRYDLDQDWHRITLVGCAPRVCVDLAALTRRPLTEVVCLPSVPDRDRVLELARRDENPAQPVTGVLVGACGAANTGKGVDLWLEMVARIASGAADLDPHFVWIGDDAPMNFDEWAIAHDLRQRVTFTGSLKNPYPSLSELDVFTLTSRADSFPMVVLEAMHLGRPVVAFAVGDVPSQIGDAGRLIPPLDVRGAAEAVIELLRDRDECRRLGDEATARARDHFPVADFAVAVQRIATGASTSAESDHGIAAG